MPEYLPDEKLMKVLEEERDRGRNEFPVRALWNSVLAGVVDATYELPVRYGVTAASVPELAISEDMFTRIKVEHPEIIERCMCGIADRGYDDRGFTEGLWEEYGIKPVIGIRNLWKDGEETKALTAVWNVVYSYDGRAFFENPNGEEQPAMALGRIREKQKEKMRSLVQAVA